MFRNLLRDIRNAFDEEGDASTKPPQNLIYTPKRKREIWKLANKWINTCCEDHQCDASVAVGKAKFFPTRVIDVGLNDHQAQFVRIVVKEEIANIDSARYATLSYCWGKSKKGSDLQESAKTTVANLQARRQGLSLEILPQTVRDAVEIARNLNIPYLWVDALCIIQDLREDFGHEIATMGEVYSYSLITIAAATSDHSNGGCLPQTIPESQGKESKRVPISTPWTGDMSSHTWSRWSMSYANNPLINRGWCLQERELSPRVIHFTRSQVLWECREARFSEKFPFKKEVRDHSSKFMKELEKGHLFPRALDIVRGNDSVATFLVEQSPDQSFERWSNIIQRYSAMSFTKIEDRLQALSGLAQVFGKQYTPEGKSKYLGGIWEAHLPEALLWTKAGAFQGQMSQSHRLSEDDHNNNSYLPTWSWISINSPVSWNRSHKTQSCVMVVESRIVPSGTNVFGNLSSGFITLYGSTKVIGADHHWLIDWDAKASEADEKALKRNGSLMVIRMTELEGLVLVPTGTEIQQYTLGTENGQYKRVGLCYSMSNDDWEDAEERVVQII